MADHFADHHVALDSPALYLIPVTPDDGADLPVASRALNVAGAGFVQLTTVTGDTGQIYVAAGIPFAVRVQRVWATGTTATGIVALA